MAAMFDTILQGLTSARKITQRNLSFGLVFILVSFFYVVEPFFLYSSHQRETVEQSGQIKAGLEQLNTQLRQIQAVNSQTQQDLKKIHERIRAYPDHLNQDVLPQIREHFYGAEGEYTSEQEYGEYGAELEMREESADFEDWAGAGAHEYVADQVGRGVRGEDQDVQFGDPDMRFGDPDVRVVVPGDITEFKDAVNWYVRNWFQRIIDDLYGDIVDPILRNDLLAGLDLFDGGEESVQLETLTHQAVDSVSRHLETINPDFWHSYEDGKAETVGELQGVIDRSFEPVTVRLDDIHRKISVSVTDMQDAMDELAVESREIQASLEYLNERINAMRSPFGAIPLRATELIVLFPLLVVLIMLFTVLSLAKSARLYSELWRLYRSDDKKNLPSDRKKQGASNGKEHVREFKLLTDCWFLPPWSSRVQPSMLILYALFMFGICIYSCYLIWADPAVFRLPGMGEETFRRSYFLAAYVAGFVAMAGTIWFGYRKLDEVPVPK